MLQISTIRDAASRTAQKHGLTKVTLFESYARGDADDASDVDLVIETSAPLGFARGAIYTSLSRSSDARSTSFSVLPTSTPSFARHTTERTYLFMRRER